MVGDAATEVCSLISERRQDPREKDRIPGSRIGSQGGGQVCRKEAGSQKHYETSKRPVGPVTFTGGWD